MFRIEAFCEDKNLPRVLHALTGLVIGAPKVQPVVNAHVKNGEIKAKGNGGLPELFLAYAKQHHLKTVRPQQIKQFAVEHGYSEKSYSNVLTRLIEAKHLRKKPSNKSSHHSEYVVLEGK